MHIVQLSYDDRILSDPAGESSCRQRRYARILEKLHPGSVITTIVLTCSQSAHAPYASERHVLPFVARRDGWRKPFAWLRLYGLLRSIDRRRHIDLVTTQTVHDEAWVALLFGRLTRRPVVGQIHTDIFSRHLTRAGSLRRFGTVRYRILRWGLPWFTAVRAVGKDVARSVGQLAPGVKIEVIPVAMSLVSGQADPAATARAPVVLFVGRLVPSKNLEGWLDIARRVAQQRPFVRFQIVGDGPELPHIREQARRMGLDGRISFEGFVDNALLSPFYLCASVFLFTSFFEGFGRVAAEALAHGLPVVAPRIAGIEDIVDDGETGFLIADKALESFVARVCWLIDHADLRDEFGARGRARMCARYDVHSLSTAWVTFLAETARGGRST